MTNIAGTSETLVTIGLTCYNAEDTIARALRSALTQDWPNVEIIIVDDCSTDGSVSVIKQLIENVPSARLIEHEHNQGPAVARNTILQNARGDFVAFFDDDDESMPARITTQVRTLLDYEAHTGARYVACYASGMRRYMNGYTISLHAIGSEGIAPYGPDLADYLLFFKRHEGWFYGAGVPSCSLLARRFTFTSVGGFDPALRRVEDADFSIRLAMHGGHFTGTREVLFTQYATNAPDKSPEKNLEAEQYLAGKNETYLRSIGRYEYARRWPKLRYWHFKRRYFSFLRELFLIFLRHPGAVIAHLLQTGPRRLLHESRMKRDNKA